MFVCFLNHLFTVPLPSLACPSHGTFVPAALSLSVSVTGSICSSLGVREAQIPVTPGLKSLATQIATSSVVVSSPKDVPLNGLGSTSLASWRLRLSLLVSEKTEHKIIFSLFLTKQDCYLQEISHFQKYSLYPGNTIGLDSCMY